MSKLEHRVSALEQVSSNDRDTIIIIRFQTPGELGREIFNLQGDYNVNPRRHWAREQGESEKAFTDRAGKDVKRNRYGVAMLFQYD